MVYGNVWQFFEEKNKKKIYKKGNLPTGKILNELLRRKYLFIGRSFTIIIPEPFLRKTLAIDRFRPPVP